MTSTAGTSGAKITLAELQAMPVTQLNYVTRIRKAKEFAAMGMETVLDLLMNFPRRWIDRTRESTIAEAEDGLDTLVIGRIASVSEPTRGRGPVRVNAVLADESGRLALVFFNQKWRSKQLEVGDTVAVFGKISLFNGVRQMVNPTVDELEEASEHPAPILPVYPQIERVKLSSKMVRGAVAEVLRRCQTRGISDPVPERIRERYHLMSRQDALVGIHLPESFAHKEGARRRLAFDELLRVQLVLLMRKREMERTSVGIRHVVDGDLVKSFHARLPYSLTGAQERVIGEIERDLASPHPMHRLLQGDVGSGKTVVAVSALLVAVQGGHQGAMMAPTEVLAEQHSAGVQSLLDGMTVPDATNLLGERPLRVELLTSTVSGEKRRDVLAGIADGSVDIVIGTHALIQEAVEFSSLGVVIVDEQHRFGVEQRAALRSKGEVGGAVPDVLVMTATPIPRTAAMTVYGDLDVSVLDEKPAGRTPIITRRIHDEEGEAEVWRHVREEVKRGRQAYVVCPLIEANEDLEIASAQATLERLTADELSGLDLALLHGRMAPAEKEAVMDGFRRGDTDVLVSTTVVEVGVDVPNATEMVILDADRFGIAQLHQLRGRVGRGRYESYCWLVSRSAQDSLVPEENPRLDALVESDDGFHLAEVDLDIRGEGTLMNKEQKGRSDLRLASLRRDRELVGLAREAARDIVDSDEHLDRNPELMEELRILLKPEDELFLTKN